ncbi:hypothetical protein OEZ85_010743 [Tetradesmus obliquus]|uniref:peptidylprolyl isomerase n=1 Tax=Tetradesmus obliquus TaxID=3088 RepID=A0ABY8TN76_TETOB|nr:hypothetical protein OEZ85_010743 [Tetradesmus obliquus]
MPAKASTVREVEQWRQHLDGAQASCKLNRPLSPGGQPSPRVHSRCMSAEPAAQPSCGICCGVRPCSPSHVHRMLRGRDSPVRSALQDCWMDAARQVKQDAAEAAVRPKAASPSRLDQDTLLATLEQAASPGTVQAAEGIQILDDKEGFGQHAVQQRDLVLVHYTGVVEETGEVFDSTRGGLKYRDGGRGVFRPLAFRLSGFPQPGVCEGLQQALLGMKIGGQRSVLVPPQLGFGSAAVLAPYAGVPANSMLRYDVELVRVSAKGPDAMMKGISQCSAGGASASAENCAAVEPAEFF